MSETPSQPGHVARAVLGLGGNLGDPAAQIDAAIARLAAHDGITLLTRAALIRTKAWGRTDQPDFTNGAILITTDLAPEPLLDVCLGIEAELGRQRREVWGPRLIDIDIITYDRLVLRTSRITLPHPYAHQRQFVLSPMREIAPELADWVVAVANGGTA